MVSDVMNELQALSPCLSRLPYGHISVEVEVHLYILFQKKLYQLHNRFLQDYLLCVYLQKHLRCTLVASPVHW